MLAWSESGQRTRLHLVISAPLSLDTNYFRYRLLSRCGCSSVVRASVLHTECRGFNSSSVCSEIPISRKVANYGMFLELPAHFAVG